MNVICLLLELLKLYGLVTFDIALNTPRCGQASHLIDSLTANPAHPCHWAENKIISFNTYLHCGR